MRSPTYDDDMQHAAWVIAPLVLVGVLTFSAVTKLGKGALLRKIIRNLRLSDRILPEPLARAIPGIELALAAGLLTPWVATFGVAAVGTLVLMLVYWALIARGLTITPRPTCGCFGQAGDHTISGRTLLRNSLLVAAGGGAVALAQNGRTGWSLLADATAGDWLWLGFTALSCGLTALVLGRFGSSTPFAMPEPPAEAPAADVAASAAASAEVADDDYVRVPTPELLLHDPDTGPVTLLELSATRAQLLVFVNCYCDSTITALARFEDWQARLDRVDVHFVFSVPILERLSPTIPPGTLVDHKGLAWRSLGLSHSPTAVLLGADGYLAGGPVHGPAEVREFIDDVEDSLREAPADH